MHVLDGDRSHLVQGVTLLLPLDCYLYFHSPESDNFIIVHYYFLT